MTETKVALITGGARGIGEGIVRVFVDNGYNVVIADINDTLGQKLADELNGKNRGKDQGQVLFVKTDLTKEEHIKHVVQRTVDVFGRIDCLINDAGWHPPDKPIDDFSSNDLRSLLELNLVAYFLMAKYSLPHLRKTKGNIVSISSLADQLGHKYSVTYSMTKYSLPHLRITNGSIVNISSINDQVGQMHSLTYSITKGGVGAMTRALAIDEAKNNVRVNAISPGSILTPLMQEWADSSPDPQAVLESEEKGSLLQRVGTPEEIGKACLYFARDGTFCTGVNLIVSGGAEVGYGIKQ